jgi:glutamate synthase domain-containing protein 1
MQIDKLNEQIFDAVQMELTFELRRVHEVPFMRRMVGWLYSLSWLCIIAAFAGLKKEMIMCGIVGYLDRRPGTRALGQTLLTMLQALGCRGPDSAGVALFGPPQPCWVLQVCQAEAAGKGSPQPLDALSAVRAALQERATVLGAQARGAYLRLEVQSHLAALPLEEHLLWRVPGVEVVSLGRQLEIFKQVGTPDQLHQSYDIGSRKGTHGIGHTRLSTESRVDLSHSQPFWAHGVPDLATVHNGHITNYHKLRRQYEQRGYRFFTENDSEIIGVYLRDRMAAGLTLADALRSSLDDFDGSFSYLAASGDCLAYVKDRFGFKPLMLAETEDFVALATEEIALRKALGRDFVAIEPAPGTMRIWSLKEERVVQVS